MNRGERGSLLSLYKALGDEKRLHMMVLLNQGEHAVGELARELAITEPTVSHHLKQLRGVGLVNMRVDGNHHFYRANAQMMAALKRLTNNIDSGDPEYEVHEDDFSWIDALGVDEEAAKVLKVYTVHGKLWKIPSKQAKLITVLDWIATQFEADRTYTEKEVNAIIKEIHARDYVSLRRDLVEFGYLRRERGGGAYWKTPEDENDAAI